MQPKYVFSVCILSIQSGPHQIFNGWPLFLIPIETLGRPTKEYYYTLHENVIIQRCTSTMEQLCKYIYEAKENETNSFFVCCFDYKIL